MTKPSRRLSGTGASRLVKRLPLAIEWLSDDESCYIAGETRGFGRAIGLEPDDNNRKSTERWDGRNLRSNYSATMSASAPSQMQGSS
jgi:hypothetical protein